MGKNCQRRRRQKEPSESTKSSVPAPWWQFPDHICRVSHELYLGQIRQVLCPRGNLALLLSNGKVVILETRRRHGARSCTSQPREVLLGNVRVCSLACGASRILFLSSEGKLYEQNYVAGLHSLQPCLQKSLYEKCIIQVSCGEHHSLALSKDGQLFAWGENTHGQLGLGDWCSLQPKPKLVKGLQSSPLAQITAGREHSIALSISGAVYSWGRNSMGQLGLGHTNSQCCPTLVASLEHKRTVFVSCGESHTAVLTKDGQLMTFGAGGCGQLGHNSKKNELHPRLVAELFGVRVSQVACGRSHTLAYVPSLAKVYSFGAGEQGQLGNGSNHEQLIPLPMKLPDSVPCTSEDLNIVADGDQSIVFCRAEEQDKNPDTRIATVEENMVEKWIANGNSKKLRKTREQIDLIFSSVACVNGSFLIQSKDEHFRTSKGISGLDMAAVSLFFKKLKQSPRVLKQVTDAVGKLLSSLPPCPVSAEALRVYLIIPELIQVQRHDGDFDTLVNLLVEAILRLWPEAQQILESLWASLPKSFFKTLVRIHQQAANSCLGQLMEPRKWERADSRIQRTAAVLQILYQVNSNANFKIEDSNFYLHELETIFYSQPIYLLIPHSIKMGTTLLKLTSYPCIFTLQSKFLLHEAECVTISCLAFVSHSLQVSRKQLLADTWCHLRLTKAHVYQGRLEEIEQLQFCKAGEFLCCKGEGARNRSALFIKYIEDSVREWGLSGSQNQGGTAAFRSIYHEIKEEQKKVIFVGEPGIDRHGLSMEFFTIITRELSHPKANIFRQFADSGRVWFPSHDPAGSDTFFMIGILMGMALFNACIADFHFPLALYKKLLNVPPTLEDLKELSPTVARNLQLLLEDDADLGDWNLYFSVITDQEESIVDLVENGSNIPVLKHNRKQYVEAYVNYVFNVSVKNQFKDFFRGFSRGCQSNIWRYFLPEELKAIICGSSVYDWEILEKNAQYKDYEQTDEVIKNFWTVFHQLPEEKKKNFLVFLTGSDRIPVGGMENFAFTICDFHSEDPDLYYPVANTCYHILKLPRYSDIRTLKERFLRAITSYETFGLE
ncbi:E3 ISG15--protein ligase HERC5 [Microcaecilia unicolor]|uniref:E3 ISG15--protein ligase HERC5-like n=1 Tax=Microcaecilia unicolor TaxID=1415580 RepID=A0A6P7X6C0_9AMPH|nr:E3 ISG15--protein ligase HERC5-like [Microcaecilia unicolor]